MYHEAVLESIISLIVVGVYIAFWFICHRKHYFRKRERLLVMLGFAMICMSTVMDITDSWGWRKKFLIFEDLDLTTILEELVFFCGGFVLLVVGVGLWVHSLVASEELEAIYHYTSDGIIVIDAKTRYFLKVNKGFCDITGYTEKELLKMRVDRVHPAEDLQKLVDYFNDIQTETVVSLSVFENVPFLTKCGWVIYCDVSSGHLVVNKKDYVVGFIRDVTDRRHTFEIEAQLASIVRSAETAILSVDKDLHVLTWNAAATRLFGYEREEILGRSVMCLVPKEALERGTRLANTVLKGNSLSPRKFRILRKDGTSIFVSFTASPIPDVDGNVVGGAAVIRDMTAEVEAEAALERERDTLKRLLEAYDRERKLIAYEIHDGLAQYIGGATMQLQALMNLPEENREASKQIIEVCYSLMNRGLRETRGLINGLRPPVLDEFGVIASIEHMACDEEDAGFPVHFTHQVSFQRLQPLLENGIFRIVQEGISNAKKHSQAGSVQVRIHQKEDKILIEIQDEGVGFDPDALTSQSFGIRGMRERVRLLNGEMEIRSAKGEGALLRVSLPLLEEDEVTGQETADETDG